MNFSGLIKRVKDLYDSSKYQNNIDSNVYAPTVALQLFKHLAKNVPNHSLILADFDCFLTPLSRSDKNFIGKNQPLVANKLLEPTK